MCRRGPRPRWRSCPVPDQTADRDSSRRRSRPASASSYQYQPPANSRPAAPGLDVRAHRRMRSWTAGRHMRRVWGLNRSGRRRWLRRWRIVWTDNREATEGICGQGQGQQEFHRGFHEVTPSSRSGLVYGGFTVRCTVGASPPTALGNNLRSLNQTSGIFVSILGPRRYYQGSYQLNQTGFLLSPSAMQDAAVTRGDNSDRQSDATSAWTTRRCWVLHRSARSSSVHTMACATRADENSITSGRTRCAKSAYPNLISS